MSNLTIAHTPTAKKVAITDNGITSGMANDTIKSTSNQGEHHTGNQSETRVTRSKSFSIKCLGCLTNQSGCPRIDSETRTTSTKTTSNVQVRFSQDEQITVLRETVIATRAKFITECSYVNEQYIDSMAIEGFLDYIERQRLTYMPHRGSRWDKVLKWAEFFALQISGCARAVGSFIPDSMDAAKLVLAASCVLLEVSKLYRSPGTCAD